MRIVVDYEKCLGYGNCVLAAPEVFDIDDTEGVVSLLIENPGESRRESVERAISSCPTKALSLDSGA